MASIFDNWNVTNYFLILCLGSKTMTHVNPVCDNNDNMTEIKQIGLGQAAPKNTVDQP